APAHPVPKATSAPLIFPLSATSPEALRASAIRLADWVTARSAAGDLDLQDLAYTLARRRAHRTVRTAVLAGDADELLTALRA
ncbi:hypothetical protein C6A85_16090, partial [Mycobacterium sp. ITM-2017-0098]